MRKQEAKYRKDAGRKAAKKIKPLKKPKPGTVYIVDCPEGWAPSRITDVPPNVKRLQRGSRDLALLFAAQFNTVALGSFRGRWAMTGPLV